MMDLILAESEMKPLASAGTKFQANGEQQKNDDLFLTHFSADPRAHCSCNTAIPCAFHASPMQVPHMCINMR
jgi:hypothetical protein